MKQRTTRGLWGMVLLAAITVSVPRLALAQAGPTAKDIAERLVRGNGFTWEGAQTRLRMVLTDAKGETKERALEVLGRRKQGRLDSIVKFLSPSDVAGTKFLSLGKEGGASEQHIYLPGLKRTRRVTGREREGSFMGSDFTYSDLAPKDDPGAKHVRLPDEKVGKDDTFVLETTPGSVDKVGYSKLLTWVRKTDYVPLRTKFFDASGKLKKTLYARRIEDVNGKPVVKESLMQSEGGHKTELHVDAIQQKDDLPDSAFSPQALERQ